MLHRSLLSSCGTVKPLARECNSSPVLQSRVWHGRRTGAHAKATRRPPSLLWSRVGARQCSRRCSEGSFRFRAPPPSPVLRPPSDPRLAPLSAPPPSPVTVGRIRRGGGGPPPGAPAG